VSCSYLTLGGRKANWRVLNRKFNFVQKGNKSSVSYFGPRKSVVYDVNDLLMLSIYKYILFCRPKTVYRSVLRIDIICLFTHIYYLIFKRCIIIIILVVCATRATKQYIYMLWNDDWKGLGICRRTQYSTLLWPPRKTSSRCKKKQTAELLNVVMHYLYGILNFDSAGECGVCGAAS